LIDVGTVNYRATATIVIRDGVRREGVPISVSRLAPPRGFADASFDAVARRELDAWQSAEAALVEAQRARLRQTAKRAECGDRCACIDEALARFARDVERFKRAYREHRAELLRVLAAQDLSPLETFARALAEDERLREESDEGAPAPDEARQVAELYAAARGTPVGWYALYARANLLADAGDVEEAGRAYTVLEGEPGPPGGRIEALFRRAEIEREPQEAEAALLVARREATTLVGPNGGIWRMAAACAHATAAHRARHLVAAASAAADCAALFPHANDRAEPRLAELIADAIDDDPTGPARELTAPKPLIPVLAPLVATDAARRFDWATARRALEVARDEAPNPDARAAAVRSLADAARGLARKADARADLADRLAALIDACSGPGDTVDAAFTARLAARKVEIAPARTEVEACVARRALFYLEGVDAGVVKARLKR
jgi:hypothetical protein